MRWAMKGRKRIRQILVSVAIFIGGYLRIGVTSVLV